MKKLLTMLSLIFLFGCAEEEFESLEPIDESEFIPPVEVKKKGSTSVRIMPAGDPNLNPNWNWEGSEWTVWFRNLSGTISDAIGTVNPFYDISAVSIFGNADPAKIDIRASDGWILVARDFGTPTAAPRSPWIMLYNKYRGLLRVCVYKTSELPDSHQTLTLSFDSSVPAPGLFIFTEDQQIAYSEAPNQQWMVGEFNLQGYDPSIPQQARLQVNIQGVAETLSYQEGGITLTGVAQPKPKPLGISNLFDIASYSSKLYDKLPDFGNDTFKNIVKGLTKSELLGAAGGLFKSFTSSGKSPMYNISLEGSISLRGTMTQTLPLRSFGVYLRTDANNSGQYKALNDISWGVMSYKRPIEVTTTVGGYYYDPNTGIPFRRNSSICIAPLELGNVMEYNPSLSSSRSKIEAGFVIHGRDEIQFSPLINFLFGSANCASIQGSAYPPLVLAMAVRITYQNGDVVYNRIPINNTKVCPTLWSNC